MVINFEKSDLGSYELYLGGGAIPYRLPHSQSFGLD